MSAYLSDGEIEESSPAVTVRRTPTSAPEEAQEISDEETLQSPKEVSRQFHLSTKSKLQKALTEYKLLFTRWKRQTPLSEVDEFDIPTWKRQDGNDILRWEFNFKTVNRTVWHPLFLIMQDQLQEALEEIEGGKFAFANITIGTMDELLDRGLAHNKELRTVLMNVENPKGSPPPKEFVAAEIDLSEFDNVGKTASGRGGGRGGGARGGGARGRGDRERRDSSRGSTEMSRGPDLTRGRGDLFRGRGDLTRESRNSSREPRDSSTVRRDASRDADRRSPFRSNRRAEPRRRRDGGEGPYY